MAGVMGCSATLRRPSAKEYYQTAAGSFEEEHYLDASEQYQELLDQYPLNPYAEESHLKAGYALFMEEDFVGAVAAFKDFERAYPTSQHMPFVKYFLGISNYSQIRSLDRDQAVTRRADGFFQEVIDRYPESAFVLEAEEKSRAARDIMARHELYVADFNEARGNIAATKARLRSIVEQYSETDSTSDALGRLQKILDDEGNVELANLASQARAARSGATEPAPTESDSVVAAGVDPLLLLVSELKKQEDAERLARTEADAAKLDAEKKLEQEELAIVEGSDDDRNSYEVGDDYTEVDLDALERERQAARSIDVEDLDYEDDFVGSTLDEAEIETAALDTTEPTDSPLDVVKEDFSLEEEQELATSHDPGEDDLGPAVQTVRSSVANASTTANNGSNGEPQQRLVEGGVTEGRDVVLDIAIEDIDFEFEDE